MQLYKIALVLHIMWLHISQLLEFDVELKEFKELKELPVDFQPRYMLVILL